MSLNAMPKLAAIQFAPIQGALEKNRDYSCQAIKHAANKGASLVVLPECCISGLIFKDRKEIRSVGETIPGPSTDAWSATSRRTGAWIIAGLVEIENEKVYNAAVIIGPQGELFRHRKLHVTGIERNLFDLGSHLTCIDTPLGKVGVAICYDMWFPEVSRAYALAGATLIATPANWSKSPRLTDAFDNRGVLQPHHVMAATAICNEVVVIAANRIGSERGTDFLGTSCILGPTGRELCSNGTIEDAAILIAELPDVDAIRKIGGSHLRSRRPRYDSLTSNFISHKNTAS